MAYNTDPIHFAHIKSLDPLDDENIQDKMTLEWFSKVRALSCFAVYADLLRAWQTCPVPPIVV